MSYDYLPKYIFRNKYSMFLQKSGLYALLPTPSHTCRLDELQPGEKKTPSFTSLFRTINALVSK